MADRQPLTWDDLDLMVDCDPLELRDRAWAEIQALRAQLQPTRPAARIVTLCGSMRFLQQILQVAAEETAKGHIVLAPFSVVAPEDQDSEFKAMLDRLHREKIDMAERVIIVTDRHGYIGRSTRAEVVYAVQAGKQLDVREFHIPDTDHLDRAAKANPPAGYILAWRRDDPSGGHRLYADWDGDVHQTYEQAATQIAEAEARSEDVPQTYRVYALHQVTNGGEPRG